MGNLADTLALLQSSKVGERQEGLTALRSTFSHSRVVANLHIKKDGTADERSWLRVFEGIFNSVAIEMAVYRKTNASTASVSKRLGELASFVRGLAEKSLTYFAKETLDTIVAHVTQYMVYRGELFLPVAADYIKTLRCLFRYQPHADNINPKQWVLLAGLAFNVVLSDPLDQPLEELCPDDEEEVEEANRSDHLSEEDETEDQAPSLAAGPSSPLKSPLKKRKRAISVLPSQTRTTKKRGQTPSGSHLHRHTSRQPQISTEQIECMALLSFLLALPKAPIISRKRSLLPSAILQRLRRFLELYPSDTSLHGDYLASLSSVLTQVCLNCKSDVSDFARRTWMKLICLWGSKNKALKEGLVAVLTVLFPYYTVGKDTDCADGLRKLCHLLNGEGHSKWGVDGLALETLRLITSSSNPRVLCSDPFSAHTFQAGNAFDPPQALTWAVLELHSDVVAKLHSFSESVGIRATSKRGKFENALSLLLSTIQGEPTSPLRCYRWQLLLFFIDRHWFILHYSFQNDVFNTLLQFISFDDTDVQSWVYLCLTAIAYTEGFCANTNVRDVHGEERGIHWETVWTHAMRRATVPLVCRSACHLAHILLIHSTNTPTTSPADTSPSRGLLPSPRVLAEIEVLLKDLDVQGPSAPYDTVCIFLSESLKVASQDVRLYRMQLEEKVLNWLIDCWKLIPVSGSALQARRSTASPLASRTPINYLSDILLLLECVCGLASGSKLVCRTPLPACWVAETLVGQARSRVIRDFLLDAKLPPFARVVYPNEPSGDTAPSIDADLIQPNSRQRKLSAYLLKVLDGLVDEWDLLVEDHGYAPAEAARSSIDFAVAALCYEFSLNLNGVRPNRRSVQLSCKVCKSISSLLGGSIWHLDEKALIIRGLEPLWNPGDPDSDHGQPLISMLEPDVGSGIHSHILRELTAKNVQQREFREDEQFRRIVWQSADVQDTFGDISETLKTLLRGITGDLPATAPSLDNDDQDGFGPSRTDGVPGADYYRSPSIPSPTRHIIKACVTFLAIVPVLQSSSGEPTRDKDLVDFVVECADSRPEKFLQVLPAFLSQIRSKSLSLPTHSFSALIGSLGDLLVSYAFQRNPTLSLLVLQLLDATLHIWLAPAFTDSNIVPKVTQLCDWLAKAIQARNYPTWQIRDVAACFLERYLSLDPSLSVWSKMVPKWSPLVLLPIMGEDDDIRVRFRAAVVNARLFAVASRLRKPATDLYESIRAVLTTNLSHYEPMVTRLLCLGNIMIVSSAVRRGAYWHLIETCLHTTDYNAHIEAILRQVAQRMGLSNLSAIFEVYASQLAFSICEGEYDVLRFPPHLLGYADRRESASAAFRAFAPTNLLGGSGHGLSLFRGHCKVLQKSVQDGIKECFGDIVGVQIAAWFGGRGERPSHQLEELLRAKCQLASDIDAFNTLLKQSTDSVVVAILRTLGDQDFAKDGPILSGIQTILGQPVAQQFSRLNRFRRYDDFAAHTPNLPANPTTVVLKALLWCDDKLPGCKDPAITFHVLHALLSSIHNSPLINEQIRLANALTVWVAYRSAQFKDFTLLHTLTQGAASLMAQSDMAGVSQSLLDWCFDLYRNHLLEDHRLPDTLIRLCYQAHDFSRDATDTSTQSLGQVLLTWIDHQASLFCRSPLHRKQVIRALPAWSHELSPELAVYFEDVQSSMLSEIIADRRISSNKFRLVRRLRDLAIEGDSEATRFGNADFWRLKECIPPVEKLLDDDVQAFTGLLLHYKGRIDGITMSHPEPSSVRTKHRISSSPAGKGWSPNNAILSSLITRLDSGDPLEVHRAYTTLRLLIASSPDITIHGSIWSPLQFTILTHLQTCMPTARRGTIKRISSLTEASYTDSFADFSRWVAGITTLLSDILAVHYPFYAQLTPMLCSDVDFAEQLLPVLVHTVLQSQTDATTKAEYRHRLTDYFSAVLKAGDASMRCLSSVVDTVLHLRHFKPAGKDALGYDKWLGLDYFLLARSSAKCGAYTTALLFLELAAEYNTASSLAESEAVLYEIYSHIDEPDGFYGIKPSDHRQFLLRRFHHEGQWDKAFHFHGAALEAWGHDQTTMDGLLRSYHSFGFNQLAISTLHSPLAAPSTTSMTYRLGWRTETWDLPDQTGNTDEISVYAALRAVHREREAASIQSIVRHSMLHEMNRLRNLGIENHAEVRDVIQNLMCLDQVGQWRSPSVQNRLAARQVDDKLMTLFTTAEPEFEFLDLESIVSTRVSLIRSVRLKVERSQIGNIRTPFLDELITLERMCLLRLSEAARQVNDGQIALNAITRAQKLPAASDFEVSKEFAHVLWLQKEEKAAVQLLQELLHVAEAKDPLQRAMLLAHLGSWTSEACLEKPTAILSQYFSPAVSLIDEIPLGSLEPTHADIYHRCAMFAERQYRLILKSPDGERLEAYAKNKEAEVDAREKLIKSLKDKGSAAINALEQDQIKAKKVLEADQQYFDAHIKARDSFLAQAIDMYSRCLASSSDYDDDGALRLSTLWFANFDAEGLQQIIETALDRIPSYKFVFLAHQLTSRLSQPPSSNEPPRHQVILRKLILRMCKEHPYHSLYQVFFLSPQAPTANAVSRRSSGRLSQAAEPPPSTQTERREAAQNVLQALRSDSSQELLKRIQRIQHLFEASLEWALFPIDKSFKRRNGSGPYQIPRHFLITKISNHGIPVITSSLPLDPTLKYDNCVTVTKFDATFTLAGGVNNPKITDCHGSDGERYKQLFKGNDDSRQDAVMEQVFELVNIVLRRDRQTKRRSLRVRGYKIVPLGPQAGVLEFVGNTIPLANWLTPAHSRYRPSDIPPEDFRSALHKVQLGKAIPASIMVPIVTRLREQFKPVMRHWFTEQHKLPTSWFSARLLYTRSVATTSIVGHILGLGDRHVSNILLEKATGEVVHIDLGIAFEQGKLLPIPERVPFRMTPDMVDGMGVSGTQGVFQRCAEETLRVLRDRSQVILTVLEVFKYDPLHSWTVSERKFQQVQEDLTSHNNPNNTNPSEAGPVPTPSTSDQANANNNNKMTQELADRVLSSVARKLDKTMSVEYEVNQLIADATDINNLACMFSGWSPFL